MSNFALDVNTPQGDIISSLNYVLSNLGTFDANIVANIANVAITSANVVTANTVTGQLSSRNSGTLSYLYNYVNVKYANNATGSSGFSSNSTNANYYGVNNTQEGTISSNPTDYVWSRVTGGFGTTKGLYFTTVGGGQIFFSANATAPSVRYSPVIDDTAILLQNLANSLVTTTTINPGAVTNVGIATQTIQTDNIGLGVITADLLSANLVIAKDIRADVGIIGDYNSPGYWMQSNTGGARFAGTMSIGNNLTVGNNAVVGNSLSIGANAFIGQGLSVGTNAIIGSGLSVGDNAVIGNSLGVGNNAVIGSNLSVGTNAVIGNNLFVGNNTQIGGNLVVAGLITAGNLNTNTVATTTIQQNAVTNQFGTTRTGSIYYYPSVVFNGTTVIAGSTWYVYSTPTFATNIAVAFTTTTPNVSAVLSGFMDVDGSWNLNAANGFSTVLLNIFKQVGNVAGNISSTVVDGSAAFTPVSTANPGPATSVYTQATIFPYRLNEVSLVDTTTTNVGNTVAYGLTLTSLMYNSSNVAPTVNYLGYSGGAAIAVSYFKR
jgi:carbonic anhydrase/acetyltransferase-like protein (isoleucine patch superfamily)